MRPGPDAFGNRNIANSTADSDSPRPWPGRIWDEGDGNPSVLEAEDTAFDSRVPDAWVARFAMDRWSSGSLTSFSARRRSVRSRHGLRIMRLGVHGDLPLFQSGGI